ncbi:membrane lipoprotein lipid attachment site-containing protein [Sporosarcina siberiensis]|uniref:Membrane lipoprotein lipid attachment site-containing protein n=1 Tax=Sporosarcina siberiensis TaxID=1365606 RepID=A0ABW4SG39_9BACL
MKRIILILVSIIALSGCSKDSSLSVSEVSQQNMNTDIQSFFQEVKEENGIHLYFDKQKGNAYVYLNGSNAILGDTSVYFTGFEGECKISCVNE